jgi:hypothetical protein
VDPDGADIDGVYDVVVTATDGLGLTDTYSLEITITDP